VGEGEGTGEDSCVLTNGPKRIDCTEDDDFMTAFDKMISESIQHRSQEMVKPPQTDITVPLHVKSTLKKSNALQSYELGKVEERNTINFLLMTRRGNKMQFKNLQVPANSDLAQNLKDKEQAERAEKERVKQLTLNINERLEEEEFQEMLATQQRHVVLNLNRDRRQRYQHPKGAPDADLIFGNKKK
jgi:regulator of nonsense transcripts 2